MSLSMVQNIRKSFTRNEAPVSLHTIDIGNLFNSRNYGTSKGKELCSG